MVIKNFFVGLLYSIVVLSLVSCVTRGPKPTVSEVKDNVKGTESDKNRQNLIKELPKVGVVLGPGGLRTHAHLGVIKSFEERQIPIHSIVGLEWGALMAALYAQKGKIHDFEWKLQKLKREHIPGTSLFRKTIKADSISKLDDYMSVVFESGHFSDTEVKVSCPVLSLKDKKLSWVKYGLLREGVPRCMAFFPFFEPQNNSVAAVSHLQESVDYLKSVGAEIIVYVDVLGDLPWGRVKSLRGLPKDQFIWMHVDHSLNKQKKDLDWVVSVNMGRFDLNDFAQRKRMILQGEKVGRKVAQELAQKYGF